MAQEAADRMSSGKKQTLVPERQDDDSYDAPRSLAHAFDPLDGPYVDFLRHSCDDHERDDGESHIPRLSADAAQAAQGLSPLSQTYNSPPPAESTIATPQSALASRDLAGRRKKNAVTMEGMPGYPHPGPQCLGDSYRDLTAEEHHNAVRDQMRAFVIANPTLTAHTMTQGQLEEWQQTLGKSIGEIKEMMHGLRQLNIPQSAKPVGNVITKSMNAYVEEHPNHYFKDIPQSVRKRWEDESGFSSAKLHIRFHDARGNAKKREKVKKAKETQKGDH